jgi:MFS family permease
VIVAAQRPITRLLEPFPEVVGLRVAVGLWVAGYVIIGGFALAPAEVRVAGMLVYGAIFALGECAYSCSYHPWLISKVPDRELTRANALSNSMMGIGVFFGPSIGVILIGTGSAPTVWLLLALMCATVCLTTVRLGHSRPPRQRRATDAAPVLSRSTARSG